MIQLMSNKSLIFICLFALYSSTYKPMTKKTLNFGEDVCYYQDISHTSYFEFVKPCESGKVCVSLGDSDYDIRKCQNSEFLPRTLNDDCSKDEDCPGTLICSSSKKCSFDGDKPYNRYCPEGKVVDGGVCKEKTNGDKCEMTDENGIPDNGVNYDDSNSPSYFRMCGLIELKKITGGNYFKKSVSKSFYCSVADDSFVEDAIVCEHGFALYFYGNNEYKSIHNPDTYADNMYLKCVTVTGIDKENKVIRYKINDGSEQYYHIKEVSQTLIDPNSYYSITYQSKMENLIQDGLTLTKKEMFENYKKRYDEIKDDCKALLYLDEPATCRDDELRKWFYFYENPGKYILYQNEPQIMEYLIQEKYPNFRAEHTSDSSRFINLNILLILLIIISL